MFDNYLFVFAEYNPALAEKEQNYYGADILGLSIEKELASDGWECTDFYPDELVDVKREKLDAAEEFLGMLSVEFGLRIDRENMTFTFTHEAFNAAVDVRITEFRSAHGEQYLEAYDGLQNTADFFMFKEFAQFYEDRPVVFNDCGMAYYWDSVLDGIKFHCREGKTYKITQVLGLETA